jgi:hypothetical protein
MRTCRNCGARLHRTHRTFLERFRYLAIYCCPRCRQDEVVPRHYLHHLGKVCRCPKCGTFRVKRLKQRDKIDPMRTGVLNWVERLSGGRLYYCCFCRLQFYDRRPLAPRNVASPATDSAEVTTQPDPRPACDTAKSGA